VKLQGDTAQDLISQRPAKRNQVSGARTIGAHGKGFKFKAFEMDSTVQNGFVQMDGAQDVRHQPVERHRAPNC
jgi:hypothetical protein